MSMNSNVHDLHNYKRDIKASPIKEVDLASISVGNCISCRERDVYVSHGYCAACVQNNPNFNTYP